MLPTTRRRSWGLLQIMLLVPLLLSVAFVAPRRLTVANAQSRLPTEGLNPRGLGMVVRDSFYEWNPASGTLNTAMLDRMGRDLAAVGVIWVRTEIHLSGLGDDYQTDLAKYDYFINVVAPANGLKVLALLSFGLLRDVNPLAMDKVNPNTGIWSQGIHADPCNSATTFDITQNWYMQRWMTRAIAVTERYRARIHAYEILNEQNRTPYNNSSGLPIRPECAARLQSEFYRRFKETHATTAADRQRRAATPVMIGGLHPANSSGTPAWTDTAYLTAYYNSAAFQDFYDSTAAGANTPRRTFPNDALAYHPYPEEITPRLRSLSADIGKIRTRLAQVRTALVDIGVADLPIWITEIGYNISFNGGTAAGQADFMNAVIAEFVATPGIATFFWFKYEDFPGNQRWGVVSVPFVLAGSGDCPGDQPGGACYDVSQLTPDKYRESYEALRAFSGMSVQQLLPLVTR